jgi:hypothetical protein
MGGNALRGCRKQLQRHMACRCLFHVCDHLPMLAQYAECNRHIFLHMMTVIVHVAHTPTGL